MFLYGLSQYFLQGWMEDTEKYQLESLALSGALRSYSPSVIYLFLLIKLWNVFLTVPSCPPPQLS